MLTTLDYDSLRASYQAAQPFKHVVIPNAVEASIILAMEQEFPNVRDVNSVVYSNPLEIKNITSGRSGIGPVTNSLIDYLNGAEFLSRLQYITGIEEPLVSDPKLMGGGLHESGPGGLLKIHTDFNRHYETGYDRRVNLLLYMTSGWKPEYGGGIELWNRKMRDDLPVVKVPCLFNTMVIFNTDEWSYHGLPDPIRCPEGMKRKSLAMYYFSNGRPEHERNPENHNSVWKARLHDDGTVYEADKDVDKLAVSEH